ncbi:DNA primase [Arachis hypogaea]|nr:DNA primase [Arachis hypogaea]
MQMLRHYFFLQYHKIQATVEDHLITNFIDQLKEGDVFIISDFKVIPNGGLVRVTRNLFRILFKCSTSVIPAASTTISNPGSTLISVDEVHQKCTDYDYLIDFVGILCGLKRQRDVESNGKILKVMSLEVFVDGHQ